MCLNLCCCGFPWQCCLPALPGVQLPAGLWDERCKSLHPSLSIVLWRARCCLYLCIHCVSAGLCLFVNGMSVRRLIVPEIPGLKPHWSWLGPTSHLMLVRWILLPSALIKALTSEQELVPGNCIGGTHCSYFKFRRDKVPQGIIY